MNPRVAAALFAALMALGPLLPSPVGAAGVGWQDIPEDPDPRTGVIPVDETHRTGRRLANETGSTAVERVDTLLGPILDNATRSAGIPVFIDGTGPDGRHGGFGEWQALGDPLWRLDPEAAHSGQSGLATGGPDGYDLGVRAMLLSPEIDLRTGLPEDADRTLAESLQDAMESLGLGNVHELIAPQLQDPLRPVRDVDTRHWARLSLRHNLGTSWEGALDGLQIWGFWQRPEVLPPECTAASGCRLLVPMSGYDEPAQAFADGPALTGDSGGWRELVFDVTPFRQGSLWIAVVFASVENAPPSYFGGGGFFPPGSDFFGAALDDVHVQVPAPPHSVRLREPVLGVVPIGRALQTVPEGQSVVSALEIANLGSEDQAVRVSTALRLRGDDSLVAALPDQMLRLSPGETVVVHASFEPPLPGGYVLDVQVALTDGVGRDILDVDPSDNQVRVPFDVETVSDVRFGEPTATARTVEKDTDLAYTLDILNAGNVPEEVTLEAMVVDATAGIDLTYNLLDASLHEQTWTIAPAATVEARWDLRTDRPGTYRLFVRTPDAVPFDPDTDLAGPAWDDTVVSLFAESPGILVDGRMGEPIWSQAVAYDLELNPSTRNGTIRAVHDDDTLYLAVTFEDPTEDQPSEEEDHDSLTLLFDDLADAVSLLGGEDGVHYDPQVEPPNWRDLHFGPPGLRGPWPWDDESHGSAMRAYDLGDPLDEYDDGYVYELTRPLGSGGEDLAADPGDAIRFALRATDHNAGSANKTWTAPGRAVFYDGNGSFPADGGLGDEMETWRLLRLPLPGDPVGGPGPGSGFRALGAVVGIDRSLPPVFEYDSADGENGFAMGWLRSGALQIADVEGVETWNEGRFDAMDRRLFYMGPSRDSVCDGEPCRQYAGQLGALPSAQEARLTTPPIFVPDGGDPYLHFEHQFSTSVSITDCLSLGCADGSRLFLEGQAWLTGEILDEASGRWTQRTQLRSDVTPIMFTTGDSPGERAVGIDHPIMPNGRKTYGNCGDGQSWDDPNNPYCQWWWPSGRQSVLPKDRTEIPESVLFEGSPWLRERVPLASTEHGQFGDKVFDARGHWVRFTFHITHDIDPGLVRGWWGESKLGWRLGALAVTPQETPLRDVAVEDLRFDVPFDVEATGLGPRTPFEAEVTVQNRGLSFVSPVLVQVTATDVATGTDVGDCAPSSLLEPLGPGETRVVTTTCVLLAEEGSLADVQARATTPGDGLALNDRLPVGRLVEVRRFPDLAVTGDALVRSAPPDVVRSLPVTIENRGNVEVADYTLTRILHQVRGDLGKEALQQRQWHLTSPLAVGENITLTDRDFSAAGGLADPPVQVSRDLYFQTPLPGKYEAEFRLDVAGGDERPDDNVARAPFEATTVLYAEDFESPPVLEPGVADGLRSIGGTQGTWSVVADGFRGSLNRLHAGQVATRDLGADTDGYVVLPEVDLTTVRDASLSFYHRYDLEEGFDAARVEVSLDGGNDWTAVVPESAPVLGLPEGYPEGPLYGDTPILAQRPQARHEAYTGSSSELPGADDGWVPAAFDLATIPALQRRQALAAFPLEDLDNLPDQVLDVGGVRQHTDDSWMLSEPGAQARQRYWWIQNVTDDAPRPHSGTQAWWSGHKGSDPYRDVWTNLTLDLSSLEAAGDEVALTFWDWRDGWRDQWWIDPEHPGLLRFGRLDPGRQGRGGTFEVWADLPGEDPRPLEIRFLRGEPDGWSQREVVLPPDLLEGGRLRFTHTSDTLLEANRGWFLDDLAVTSYEVANGLRIPGSGQEIFKDDLEGLTQDPTGSAGWFDVERHGGKNGAGFGYAPAAWSLVGGPSASAKPGGWHLEEAERPDGTTGKVWRFSSPVEDRRSQGYPHSADSRLVTPLVDLAGARGESADLVFRHRYGFEATTVVDVSVARDGGAVEVQVFDEATGAFGEWTPLYAHQDKPFLAWFMQQHLDVQDLGYSAIYQPLLGLGFQPYEKGLLFEADVGAPFPMATVYSGEQDEWEERRFDLSHLIGKKVRFAFHASTNPSYGGRDPLHGWSVSDVAVEADVFAGAPARLRLRVVTDQSLGLGGWSIDDLALVGSRYSRNVAVLADPEGVIVTPEGAEVSGRVTNIGTEPRGGLAVQAFARGPDGEPVPLALEATRNLEPLDGVPDAWGTFSLTPGGQPGSEVRFSARLDTPQDGTRVYVRLLEDRGTTAPDYAEPRDEVPGNTKAEWAIETQGLEEGTLVAPRPERTPRLLVADPAGGDPDEPVTLTAAVRNDGPTEQDFDVEWSVLDRRTDEVVTTESQVLSGVAPGETRRATLEWTPDAASVYRVTADFPAPVGESLTLDLPVGVDPATFEEDFEGTAPEYWAFQRSFGSTQWAFADGRMRWGVSEEEYAAETDYCDAEPCDEPESFPQIEQPLGPEDTASTGNVPIDLRTLPDDRALLSLFHDWDFAPGDGGRVEAAVFLDPGEGTYKYVDGQGGPVWFPLTPEGGYPGVTRSHSSSINPLGDRAPVFAGSSPSTRTVFDLNGQGLSFDSASVSLVGEQIALRMHVGVGGASSGGRGWSIERITVGPPGIALGPTAGDPIGFDVVRPIVDGAGKRFFLTVQNDGPVDEVVGLSHNVVSGGANASWIGLPQATVQLVPGEARPVPFEASLPADPTIDRGMHAFTVDAEALGHSGSVPSQLLLGLKLQANPLPDLALDLTLGGEGGVLEAGSPVTLHAIVSNLGRLTSLEVPIVFTAGRVGGTMEEASRQTLVPLCPIAECGVAASRTVVSAEWFVPDAPGDYLVRVVADPDRLVLEEGRTNNVAEIEVPVDVPEKPDLAVTSLEVEGAGPDGFVENGTFFTLNATVANLGRAPARNVRVIFFLGSSTLSEQTITEVVPGDSHELRVTKLATRAADQVAKVQAISVESGELRTDNDQISRVVRVRERAFALTLPQDTVIPPGGTTTVQASLANQGNTPERVLLSLQEEGWGLEVRPTPVVVAAGQTVPVQLVLKAPATAAGTFNLTLLATPPGAKKTAQAFPLPVTVPIVGQEVVLQPGGGQGPPDKVRIPLRVTNQGDQDRTLTIGSPAARGGLTVVFKASQARSVELEIDLGSGTPPGYRQLEITATDGDGDVLGHTQVQVLVEPLHRADVIWLESLLEPRLGEDGEVRDVARVKARVVNAGNQPVDLRARLVGATPLSIEPDRLDLPVGGEMELSAEVSGDSMGLGDIALELVDGRGKRVSSVRLPGLTDPLDLRVEDLVLPPRSQLRAGKVAVEVVVVNGGTTPVEPARVLLFRDTTLAGVAEIPRVGPGERLRVNATMHLVEGKAVVLAFVDGGAASSDVERGDNGFSTVADVMPSGRSIPAPGVSILAGSLVLALWVARRRRP